MARDVFAQIAADRLELQKQELEEPVPQRFPRNALPLEAVPRGAGKRPDPFADERKIATEADLSRELVKQRAKHERFLRKLAPELESTRSSATVAEMDWRVETDEDRRDFGRVLSGGGSWTRVQIPHYGEPIGKAVTHYRAEITVTAEMRARGRIFLRFKAVDYIAHVFVNGSYLGSHEGFFAPFELDFTSCAREGANVLVVKVENDYIFLGNDDPPKDGKESPEYEGEKLYAATGLGYDDPLHGWHHCPPGMGICQDVIVEARPDLYVHDVFVRPVPGEGRAEAWVEVASTRKGEHEVLLDLSLYGENFEKTVFTGRTYTPGVQPTLGRGDVPGKHALAAIPLRVGPGVNLFQVPVEIPSPRLWSPAEPWLYRLQVKLREGDALRDAASSVFGMRSFAMDETSTPKGRLYLNGTEVRLRGANTMGFEQQDVLHKRWDRLVDDILLAKICNMNFLRLTQRPVQSEVYEYCDRLGLMTQTDLPLFGVMRRTKFAEGVRQAEEMERLVRGHPCNIMVTYINEAFPLARNKPHRNMLRHELDGWVEAANHAVRLVNPDRVIKPHDGDYDPPETGLPDHHCYNGWYNGHGLGIGRLHRGYWQRVKPGWLYGCGEFGSEGLDPVNVMRKHYPRSWLPQTPGDEAAWSPNSIIKSQTGRYHYMWFDTKHTLEGWARESHRHQAWATRLMTEAFRRDARMNTFAIHLFIDAFPSGWMKSIMDVERQPKAAYFAYRDALTPLMVSLRTDRNAVFAGEKVRVEAWVCNDRAEVPEGCRLVTQVRLGRDVIAEGETEAKVPACSSAPQGLVSLDAPEPTRRMELEIRVGLKDKAGRTLHSARQLVSVFPRPRAVAAGARPRAVVLGAEDGPAATLRRGLGLREATLAEAKTLGRSAVILADDWAAYRKGARGALAAVRAGATLVFLELPQGTYDPLGESGAAVEVKRTGMYEFFFASRATGHALVTGFQPEDFKFWYDPAEDCVMPVIGAVLLAPGWSQILASGVVGWGADGGPAQAAVERREGEGVVRVCQVRLARMLANPAAMLFARRLVGMDGTDTL
jgi:hypothetical protein